MLICPMEAELSQGLVHVEHVREPTQACTICLLTAQPSAPAGGSVALPQLIDKIDEHGASGRRHDDVGGREIAVRDASTVQSTHTGGNAFNDLPARRDGTQVWRPDFRIERTPRHVVVDDCPATVVGARNIAQSDNMAR